MNYVIGCDVGSQGTKAALLAEDGALAGEAHAGYAIDFPQPLWAEQPAERWTEALALAVRRLLAETGVAPELVRALGVAAQVDGLVPVGGDGRPLRPAIIWMDRRAASQCAAVRATLGDARALALSGLNLDASHVAPKIRWFIEHEPALAERAAYFLLPGSFVAHELTGELAVDYSNASSTLLMDVRSRDWSDALCAAFAVDRARLAPIRPAAAPLGRLRPAAAEALGLRPETLVVVGCGDEHAACLGAGVVRPGLVGDIVGTAEPVCAAADAPLFDPSGLVETHCHADADLWLIENPGFVSGGNVRWFRDQLAPDVVLAAEGRGRSPYALLDAEAAPIAPGAEGVVFLPCLMGAMAPTWNEAARGVFAGFTLAHTRAHLFRAVLEGSAFAVRDITDRMRAIGLDLDELRVMGGGARSRLWNQIKADVTGLPVAVSETAETTALGAGLLALVGAGLCGTLAEACGRAVRVRERLEPRPAAQAAYEEPYARYRATYFATLPVLEGAPGTGYPATSV